MKMEPKRRCRNPLRLDRLIDGSDGLARASCDVLAASEQVQKVSECVCVNVNTTDATTGVCGFVVQYYNVSARGGVNDSSLKMTDETPIYLK